MLEIKNFINNEYKAALSGNWLDVFEPATGKVYAKLANSDAEDIDLAVRSAKSAFPGASRGAALRPAPHLHRYSFSKIAAALIALKTVI